MIGQIIVRNTLGKLQLNVSGLSVHGTTLEVVGDAAAEHGIAVHELYQQSQSLEDVFLQLTEGTEAGR